MAVALLGIGRVSVPGRMYLLYPLMAIGFALSAGVPSGAIITRWFVARRALAMSISQTGVSVGGVVLVPLATAVIEGRGLGAATVGLTVLLLAVALPVTLLVLRFDPVPMGLVPDGEGAPPPASALLGPEVQLRRWTTRQVLATPAFWLLALAFAAVLFAQQGLMIHQIAFLRAPLGASGAALAVSVTAFGSIVARLVVGSFADRVDKRRVALGLVLLQALVYFSFSVASERATFFGASLVLGFTIGNLFMMQSLLVGELFGMVSFGSVLGTLQLVTQLVGGLGPLGLGLLFRELGGYQPAIRVLVAVALLSALALALLRPPAGLVSGPERAPA
jgi:sugar phosphate permease